MKAGSTIIKMCQCKHEFQDQTYGKGMRVMNRKGKNKEIKTGKCKEAKCTCCARIHEI